MISDAETKKVIDEYFIPSFKIGLYYQGVFEGSTQLMKLLLSKTK
jgi:uncharacterized membrane protein YgcG